MTLIAHRGFAAEHPENTLAAFRAAARAGADAVELDVRCCGSGDLVVVHDATVDRVTDATGAVREHSLAELRALSVLDAGEGIPALADVFEALPPDVGVNVELKEPDTAADAAAVAGGRPHDVLVSSFHPDALAAVRDAEPSLPLALLFADGPDRHLELAGDLDCAAVHPERSLCAGTGLVEAAHDRDLRVNAWTVGTAGQARRLRAAGVDGLIADRSDVV